VSGTDSSIPEAADANAPPAGPSATGSDGSRNVRLVPGKPPGRGTRKALPFGDEIRRLYAMGYTLGAIREALAAVGVSVSRSTVHREARRPSVPPPLPAVTHETATSVGTVPAPLQSERPHANGARDPPPSPSAGHLLGRKSAEAFFTAHERNPLFPTKETS
jgi:hypothetical protein